MPRRARHQPLEPPGDDAAAGVSVVDRRQAAGSLLDPVRRRILTALQTPGSAAAIASGLGLSRQLANYHVRQLERAGLVEEVDRVARRGCEERIVRATASHYLISPDTLGALGATKTRAADRFSATYQVAVAARTIRDVAALAALAREAGQRLTTLTLDVDVRLASPAAREAFGNELVDAVTRLAAKYHDEHAADGRTYRLFAGAHPVFRAPAATPKSKPRAATARAPRGSRT